MLSIVFLLSLPFVANLVNTALESQATKFVERFRADMAHMNMSIDPLTLDPMDFKWKLLQLKIQEHTIEGLSGLQLKHVQSDLLQRVLDIRIVYPRLFDSGFYRAQIGVFPMRKKVNGTFQLEMKNVEVQVRIVYVVADPMEVEVFKVLDIHVGQVSLKMNNLTKTTLVSIVLRDIIDEAAWRMVKRLEPKIIRILETMGTPILKNEMRKLTLERLLSSWICETPNTSRTADPVQSEVPNLQTPATPIL